ncbi:anti-anti-sigma factor [Asanoa hainanensis]|uniref:Anti-sigma factor antagonist n=1 Tax=Asanoa hainanensis TaxID=560556 RepID=A0A239PER6_9ACTN|nr:STAS domain-containing protein [Asanoa hainanensis]SNT65530.1 anti-anti-sigma factor [Asanoa hainanensis]
MTAVPSSTGTTIDVICDSCGVVVTATNTCVHDEDLVWTVLIEIGWAGSPFAAGRHSCTRCATMAPGRVTDAPTAGQERFSPARFGVHSESDVVVVAANGDIDTQTSHELQALLSAPIAAGRPVILDLEGVNLVDSAALGVLVRARQEARRRHVPLCLAAPSRFLLTVLHTMRLRHAFPIFGDRASALSALAGERSGSPARTARSLPVNTS